MLKISIYLVLASAALSLGAFVEPPSKCGYESCVKPQDGLLNVHLVAHTHDDVGWLKTVDQYYYGSRNDIQKAGVQYILDSVIKELWEKADRKFIYVETAFFWKWWVRQSDDIQHKVHVLVREGRLQFVGGAWSMNDEAAVHYQTTIDQFTWGLQKLNETFGECGLPRVGWQIDPFGHSREFASLLAAMGYDGLFLGRIDYQDKSSRLQNKNMEMLWRGDDVLGKASDIFTGVNYNTYSPPTGFCFDVLCNDEPIIDDPDSPMFNVDKRVSDFLAIARNMSKSYRTNNILVTMGEDFQYQDAAMWFTNLDKLIEHANLKAAKEGLNITLFYSTPTCYLKAVKDSKPTLPTKQDDFFPYASDPNAFWTGYFTSRPTTKYFEREGNHYLQVAKQLQVLANLEEHNMFVLNELKSAMGVMQHHDAITGTEKQHVTHDYERLLDAAIEDALIIPRQAITKFTQGDALAQPVLNLDRCKFNETSCVSAEKGSNLVVTVYNPLAWEVTEPVRVPVVAENEQSYEVYDPSGEKITCQLLTIPNAVKNIPTRESIANYEVVIVPTLPPLGYRSYYLKKTAQRKKRSPKTKKGDVNYYNINEYWKDVKEKSIIEIENIEEKDVIVKHKIPDAPRNFDSNINVGKTDFDVLKDRDNTRDVKEFEKVVEGEMRGVKHERKRSKENVFPNLNEEEMRMLSDEPQVVEMFRDDVLQVDPVKISIGDSGITYQKEHTVITVGFYYYPACVGNNIGANRSSGAYIFRPNATEPIYVEIKQDIHEVGPVVQESTVVGENFANTLRAYQVTKFFEIDTIVGPIDIKDDIGKEYIARYSTNINNNGEFYTDSNARQLLKRKLDQRPQWNVSLEEPISGNYYPVSNFITIKDGKWNLNVVTDRSEGGSSLAEGQIELMLHRRLLHDDSFGVGEALNETAKGVGLFARIIHRVFTDMDALELRKAAIGRSLHPRVFVSNVDLTLQDWLNLKNEYSWLNTKLVDGLHLLTLEPWGEDLLIRFENLNEKPSSLDVDLASLFKNIKIKSVKETTLAANRWLEDYKQWEWDTEKEFSRSFNEAYGSFNAVPDAEEIKFKNDDNGLKINLKSKQIRTFIAKYDYV